MICPYPQTRYLTINKVTHKWDSHSSPPPSGPYRVVQHACGQCLSCRKNHAKQWAARCCHEASLHQHNIFLNLTVNDSSLPKLFERVPITNAIRNSVSSHRKRHHYKPEGGFSEDCLKTGYVYSLNHRPIQLFLKRLRKLVGPAIKIKYLVAGEYGPSNFRPHFHLIIFGWRPDDLQPWSARNGNILYRSATLERLWSDPDTREAYGYSLVGSVTPASANYVAQYCLKKVRGKGKESYYGTLSPEYLRMSQGIGKEWIARYSHDVYPSGTIEIEGKNFCAPPRYYNEYIKKNDPALWYEYQMKVGDIGVVPTPPMVWQTAKEQASTPHIGLCYKEAYYDSRLFEDGYVPSLTNTYLGISEYFSKFRQRLEAALVSLNYAEYIATQKERGCL